MRYRFHRQEESQEINMTPLIDMVFILLIFFLVTTSFVREAGIEVNRPSAVTSEKKENVAVIIGISPEGRVFLEGHPVDIRNIQGRMSQFLSENPKGQVVVMADRSCPTGITVTVLDLCRLAGVTHISVATKSGAGL